MNYGSLSMLEYKNPYISTHTLRQYLRFPTVIKISGRAKVLDKRIPNDFRYEYINIFDFAVRKMNKRQWKYLYRAARNYSKDKIRG